MAKTLANYDPLVQIPSGMTPAGADFPIVESHDILVGENDKRLDAKLDDIDSAIGNVGQTPIATQLSSKVNTGDIVTSVAATGSTSNNKIPSETAVRAAIEAKTINVDSTVTEGSANAVSGGAVHTQLATKQDALTFDTTPTASSSNPVTSGGVKSALDTKQDALTFDTTPTASSSNPVTSGGVKAALDNKQNILTYETTPIVGSVNPVTSTGIRNAIDAAAAGNLGQMQLQYDEFVSDAEDVLEQAKSLSNGMVACSNIDAETTVGDTRILLYTGTTNSKYTNGHWYYNSAASNAAPSWTDGGAVGSAPTIDNTLTVEGAAANSKAVGDAIENIVTISNTQPGSNSGNKVWIRETTNEEVQVPTYAEHIAKANKADIATNNESDNGSGTISASKAYAIGDHFYINNTNTSSENYGVSTLYKATAAIASGDAIVVGTNCEASKVADEITSLSNDIDTVKADLADVTFPLELVATYDNKILRVNGLQDNTDYVTYVYVVPNSASTVHIKTNFYGNVFIIFTDMNEVGDFSASPHKNYPTSGYPTPTTVDEDYATMGYKYVWVPLYKKSNIITETKVSLVSIVENISLNTIVANNTNGGLADFNDTLRNHIYSITSGMANISNYPPIQNGGTLFCFASYTIDNVQIFVSNQMAIYMRRKWGSTWSEWSQIPTTDVVQTLINTAVNTAVNTAFSGYYPFNILQAFKNITCIGDSLTYSQVYIGNSTSRQAYKPYPKVLAYKAGATETILATAGDTAQQAWNRNGGNIVQKDAQLTIIYLGTNGGLTDTIDTDCTGNDYAQWADTNTGCYAKLIAKSQSVGSRVVLVKLHTAPNLQITNGVIDKMGAKFNVPVISNTYLSGIKYHSYPDGTGTNGTHYNDFGYAVFADQIANSISQLPAEDAVKIIPI